jgi:hypothetical protein
MSFAALAAGRHEPDPPRAFDKPGFRQRRKGKDDNARARP